MNLAKIESMPCNTTESTSARIEDNFTQYTDRFKYLRSAIHIWKPECQLFYKMTSTELIEIGIGKLVEPKHR